MLPCGAAVHRVEQIAQHTPQRQDESIDYQEHAHNFSQET